jgi:Na+-driven multidrug efflux pump
MLNESAIDETSAVSEPAVLSGHEPSHRQSPYSPHPPRPSSACEALLWQLLVAPVGVFIDGAIRSITTTAFYATGDTRTPTRLGIWTYAIYVPLTFLAFLKFGLINLAGATSMVCAATLILQHWLLRRCIIRLSRHEAKQ